MGIDVEAYYKQYGPMVLRRCRWILKDEDKALDAMQDVFVLLLQYQERLKGEYPSSLLYRIATNVCLNRIRFEKRRPETRDEEIMQSIASAEDTHSRTEAKDFLDRLFDEEAESTKVIAFLYFVDRMTLEEVAKEVGLSVSGVRKRLRNLQAHAAVLKEAIV